jgi:hypothetical protein
VAERVDHGLLQRRPIYQAVLFWDVFRKHFNAPRPPAFSTFFTNHVAGVMHRYWCDVFPEDFPDRKAAAWQSQERLMRFALRVLDRMLADVLDWARRNEDLVVIFASSMGQGAVHRDYHEGVELLVDDLPSLLRHAGLEAGDYRPLLAMVPQVAIEVDDAGKRKAVKDLLEGAACANGERFVSVREAGISLSITLATPSRDAIAAGSVRIGARQVPWRAAGIRPAEVDPGTGYHIAEGTLAVHAGMRSAKPLMQDRTTVRADRLKSWMLDVLKFGRSRVEELARID